MNRHSRHYGHTLVSAYDANAEIYVRLRRFRNIPFASSAFTFTLVVTTANLSVWKPSMLSMCFDPDPSAPGLLACPTRSDTEQTGGDVAPVASLGLVGATLASLRSVTRSTSASVVAYSLRMSRAVLKLTTGAVTAVVGILALKAGVVSEVSDVDDRATVLFYAVLFGGAQQLITKLIDQQAEDVLASASSEADEERS